MTLTDREIATLQAAVRFWQMARERDIPGSLQHKASRGGLLEPLKFHELDELHEKIGGEE